MTKPVINIPESDIVICDVCNRTLDKTENFDGVILSQKNGLLEIYVTCDKCTMKERSN